MLENAQEGIIQLLLTYRYLILLPISIVEGPIITVIAGFFAVTGLFNPFIIYGIVILGDLMGDTLAYSIGRFGGHHLLKTKFGHFIGVTPEKLEEAKDKFQKHHRKTIIFSKIFHGFGITGLTAAGVLKINYLKYLTTCLFVSIIQSAMFLLIGLLFGSAYQTLGQYIDYFAATTITIGSCVVIFLIVRNKFKAKKNENNNS
ncbi:DedA family protein [Candidatus Gracilibacteria bacterium]|nr:DedA family protein [Candidatus Gracilibacteria bacterium]